MFICLCRSSLLLPPACSELPRPFAVFATLSQSERERERETCSLLALGSCAFSKSADQDCPACFCVPFTSLLLVVDIVSCLRLFRRQNKGALSSKCSCVEKSTFQAPAPKFEGGRTHKLRSICTSHCISRVLFLVSIDIWKL